jgi:hypothetical protein
MNTFLGLNVHDLVHEDLKYRVNGDCNTQRSWCSCTDCDGECDSCLFFDERDINVNAFDLWVESRR